MALEIMSFDVLHKEFNSTNNVSSFVSSNQNAINYLLIRSLDKPHLIDLLNDRNVPFDAEANKKIEDLYRIVYLLNLEQKDLIAFIKKKYPEVKKSRLESEQGLNELLKQFGNVRCGLRNDRLDAEVQKVIRNKSIRSWDELSKAFESLVIKARQYAEWSYVNQASTDLIEHFVNDHENVIPTLRKIPHVDFFYNFEGVGLVPFDLKITNISEDYFNEVEIKLYEQSCNQLLRECFKNIKKTDKSLPVLSIFDSTEELYEFMVDLSSRHKCIDEVLNKIKKIRNQTVIDLMADRRTLELWNYVNQGPRLFCNNNRFFVFLAYKNNFGDARGLKKKVELIGNLITNHLTQLKFNNLNNHDYTYDEEIQLRGNYSTTSSSVLLAE